MTTIKSFTDVPQSKKLAGILPVETADMYYYTANGDLYKTPNVIESKDDLCVDENSVPCWSLAALLNYLRDINFFPNIEADEDSVTMSIDYFEDEDAMLLSPMHNITTKAETFIDACYELILKLHDLKIL